MAKITLGPQGEPIIELDDEVCPTCGQPYPDEEDDDEEEV
jgi:hypothetical protein